MDAFDERRAEGWITGVRILDMSEECVELRGCCFRQREIPFCGSGVGEREVVPCEQAAIGVHVWLASREEWLPVSPFLL